MIKAEADADVRSPAPPLEPDVPRWIQLPVRVLAALVLVPVGLLWVAVRLTGRLLRRYLIRPLGWAIDRLLWRPLAWVAWHLVWRPLVWVARYVLWRPLVWVARYVLWLPLVWVARYLLWLPLVWVARYLLWYPLVWLVRYVVLVPLGWLHRLLSPPVRAFVRMLAAAARWVGGRLASLLRLLWVGLVYVGRLLAAGALFGWWLAGVVGRFVYRFLLRPVGLAVRWAWRSTVVPIGRAIRWGWSHSVLPMGRWLRDGVIRPVRATTRQVFVALGFRRRA